MRKCIHYYYSLLLLSITLNNEGDETKIAHGGYAFTLTALYIAYYYHVLPDYYYCTITI